MRLVYERDAKAFENSETQYCLDDDDDDDIYVYMYVCIKYVLYYAYKIGSFIV